MLKTPLKILGHLKFGYQPGDREQIEDRICWFCREGVVKADGGELSCSACLVEFVEAETPASEFAHKDNVREAHSRPRR